MCGEAPKSVNKCRDDFAFWLLSFIFFRAGRVRVQIKSGPPLLRFLWPTATDWKETYTQPGGVSACLTSREELYASPPPPLPISG